MSSFLSMGKETFKVPLSLFAENRQKLVSSLRGQTTAAGIVVLEGGPSATRFDSDHEPLFRQESYFWWLCGVKEPDCSLAIEVDTGRTTLFVPKLPPEYATIMGKIATPKEWRESYQVDDVKYTVDIDGWLETTLIEKENGVKPRVLVMKGLNSDSGNEYTPPKHIVEKFDADTDTLFPILAECRVCKSPAEQQLMRYVTEITSHAHVFVMQNVNVKDGAFMEYQGESLFRHYCLYNFGCRNVSYIPICGCGPNAAILHYGHAGEPNARQLADGDICLFDMGAEYQCYGSDVTSSFPANGKFTEKQKKVYESVLAAQVAVYNMMKPGCSWVACHKAAEAEILKGLNEMGLVDFKDKTVEELVEARLGAVFMPHGLGHLIGIDTHDVGGYLPGHPKRTLLPGLKSLRTSRTLLENMLLTVEPGLYFIDHLLDEAMLSGSPLKPYLVKEKIDEFRGFGGVRLEDVVLVTETGCVNFTLCPRTVTEVEAVMAGGKWPPVKDSAPELRRMRLTDSSPLPSTPI